MNNIFIKLLLFLVVFCPFVTSAVVETGVGNNVIAKIEPASPKPGDDITISLSSYGFDINRSRIIWYKDGKETSTGADHNHFSFRLGQVGSPTKIAVSVYYGNRHVADKSFYFDPADINILWQADTLVPPLYKGKARATAGSKIKIVAYPSITNQTGQLEKTDQLIYTWYQNGLIMNNSSGVGKNVINISTKPTDSQVKINLNVSNKKSDNSVDREFIIYLSQPEIAFYELTPLKGVNYQKQILTSFDLYEEEVSFQAFPFFWPTNLLSNLDYFWTINSLSAKNQGDPNSLTVRQPENGAGVNDIRLRLEGLGSKQEISSRFNIKFGNNLLKSGNGN